MLLFVPDLDLRLATGKQQGIGQMTVEMKVSVT
jgi:hypothetical protein